MYRFLFAVKGPPAAPRRSATAFSVESIQSETDSGCTFVLVPLVGVTTDESVLEMAQVFEDPIRTYDNFRRSFDEFVEHLFRTNASVTAIHSLASSASTVSTSHILRRFKIAEVSVPEAANLVLVHETDVINMHLLLAFHRPKTDTYLVSPWYQQRLV